MSQELKENNSKNSVEEPPNKQSKKMNDEEKKLEEHKQTSKNSQQPNDNIKKQANEIGKEVEQKQQQIPDKFYDSDLASVNQKDFLSDNEPPKDIIHERKLLHKQKTMHIYKTIISVGSGIDKPAPFDQIKLRYKYQQNTSKQGVEEAKTANWVANEEFLVYNLGKENREIETLVISMKRSEIALFQIQQLQVSKKSNIKVLKQKKVIVIEVETWITAIDIDENKDVLKYIIRRGEGPFRVSKYDEVSYQLNISYKGTEILNKNEKYAKMEVQKIKQMQPIVWKIMSTMKKNQLSQIKLSNKNMKLLNSLSEQINLIEKNQQSHEELQEKPNKIQNESSNVIKKLIQKNQLSLQEEENISQKDWKISIDINDLISIDDIFMDGTILKKLILKGVSTAKPQSSSLIYYALRFLDSEKKILFEDACFNSDWWEDYRKLDQLGCRKNYLDQYKVSKFLKCGIKRMKPAQISQLQCRNMDLFKYGQDFEELKKLWPQNQQFPPNKVYLVVRVYNFTEGKNCFNMTIEQKIQESKRKKIIAIKLLNENKIQKAYKKFENIVSFYNSGDITQAAYEQKISALMNSILCLMKQNKYSQMIPLCNIVLEKPKHGFNQDKMRLQAQGIKVEGKVKNAEVQQLDSREAANLDQNPKILDKCLYRKALALARIGEGKKAIETLSLIQDQNEQVKALQNEAQKLVQNYEQKSRKILKAMFGS